MDRGFWAMAGRAQAKFLEGNLFRHVSVMALTSSVGLMAVFVVDLINMIYISMLGRAELAAAIGYAGAILFFTTSFGIGMSHCRGRAGGAGAGRARSGCWRGRGRRTGWSWASSSARSLRRWSGCACRRWSALLGATGETHDLAVHFLQIVIPSQPLLMVGMIGGAILRSHGDARSAMMATVWGAVATAVLDPILIFGLGWELTGAAIAAWRRGW